MAEYPSSTPLLPVTQPMAVERKRAGYTRLQQQHEAGTSTDVDMGIDIAAGTAIATGTDDVRGQETEAQAAVQREAAAAVAVRACVHM